MITRETVEKARSGDERALKAVLAEANRQEKKRNAAFKKEWAAMTPEERDRALAATMERFHDVVMSDGHRWAPSLTGSNGPRRNYGTERAVQMCQLQAEASWSPEPRAVVLPAMPEGDCGPLRGALR